MCKRVSLPLSRADATDVVLHFMRLDFSLLHVPNFYRLYKKKLDNITQISRQPEKLHDVYNKTTYFRGYIAFFRIYGVKLLGMIWETKCNQTVSNQVRKCKKKVLLTSY